VIHFWLPECPPADEILDWDPDREPWRYASGIGHNMLELYRRLAATSLDVSLGPNLPKHARLAVLYAVSIEALEPRKAATRVIRRARGRYALIRADAPLAFRMPVRPVLDVMPVQASAQRSYQRWLPPLPQRGLVPRLPGRLGSIRSVAFKGNPENVPPEMKTKSWAAALAARGISWWLDVPKVTDGPDQRWHDFAAIDVVICMRNRAKASDIARKPGTKLVNAWRAGCIPLAHAEPAYRELGTDGEDVFFVEDAASCLEVLDRLSHDSELMRRVEDHIRLRREDYGLEVVLPKWRDALVGTMSARECTGADMWARTGLAAAAQMRQIARWK
jgi:hypothetical protein